MRLASILLWLLVLLLPGQAMADRLDTIVKRGTLIVGVKTDYPPFGMRDPKGELIGFEPDLAADLASRLGVGLQLVGVTTANRLQKVEDGTVDVIVATLGDTAQRRQIATLIEPNYYASGVTVMTGLDRHIDDWNDLRGQRVCATQGALFNRPMAQRYLLDLQIFNGTRDAKMALRDGRCMAWLYDDTAIAGDLLAPEWDGYGMPLPSSMVAPWSIAIAAAERGSRLERFLSDSVADWHRTGTLMSVERRWGLKPSAFLAETNRLWTAAKPDGTPLCARTPDGEWPADCRNKALLTSTDVGGLHRLGLLVKERTGLDLSLVYDDYDRGQFLHGLRVTAQLVVACLFGSLLVGLFGAILVEARVPLLGHAVTAVATLGRMTPPLLQMYVIFFGIGGIVVTRYGWTFDGFVVASACLSLYAGSANVFAFLEASAVVRRTLDRDYRLGLRNAGPALRLGFGALAASLVNIVKATGMASTIAVPELISASTAIVAERGNPEVMMNVLMVVYFLIVLAVVRFFRYLETKVVGHGAA